MMNKAKRKEQPYNARRYWLFFSVLAVLLLIPFRIVGYWMLTDLIYISISVLVMIAVIRFVRRYSWRKWIVGLMLICALLPIGQILTIDRYCSPIFIENGIQLVRCGICHPIKIVMLKGTSLGIQTEVDFTHIPFMYDGLIRCSIVE